MVRLLLSLMHPFIWKANALHVLLWDASIVIAETQSVFGGFWVLISHLSHKLSVVFYAAMMNV